MITLLTALFPEAKAVISTFSMKRAASHKAFTLYETNGLRLLITGVGKLNAAIAVTEYLTRYSFSTTDLFCNLGICGGSHDTSVGSGFFCAAITDVTTEKTLYPELYAHPFLEARLFTFDVPVTTPPTLSHKERTLPALYDMEAYGVGAALFRQVTPSRCFFYKVVSDFCDGAFPTGEAITTLLLPHLTSLLSFLKETEETLLRLQAEQSDDNRRFVALTKKITDTYPFTTAMEHKLTNLLTYALRSGIPMTAFLETLPAKECSLHKKQDSLKLLQKLEIFLLSPPAYTKQAPVCVPQKHLQLPRHIYVEKDILSHPLTLQILARLPHACVIPVTHYKDVFNRSHQDLYAQETAPAFILAANRGTLFYPGAPVCQSFGEEHFMYTSCIMNCIYDCDYCYLQGMYPSGNIVVFVNLEDYFSALEAMLKKHPVYLCCSYDSDLTALNGIFPHAEEFCRYAAAHPALRLELRTKSAALPFIKKLPVANNIVMAFTLSPQEVIDRYEHYTPSLRARLAAAKAAATKGVSLRLCIDPILDMPQAEASYTALIEQTFLVLAAEEITDISLGVFRLSKDYLKQLKRAKPACAVSHYPYEQTHGVCHYPAKRCDALVQTVRSALQRHGIPDEKIFIWTPDESGKENSYAEQ